MKIGAFSRAQLLHRRKKTMGKTTLEIGFLKNINNSLIIVHINKMG